MAIWDVNHEKHLDHEPVSPVNFMDYRGLGQVFTDAAAWWRPEITLRDQDQEPVRVNTVEVSGNFLTVVGVRPILGVGFPRGCLLFTRSPGPHEPPPLGVALLGRRGDRRGKRFVLNDDLFTVAGVMPRGFAFPGDTDLWQRLSWDLTRHSRGAHFMEAVARMKPGTDAGRRAA